MVVFMVWLSNFYKNHMSERETPIPPEAETFGGADSDYPVDTEAFRKMLKRHPDAAKGLDKQADAVLNPELNRKPIPAPEPVRPDVPLADEPGDHTAPDTAEPAAPEQPVEPAGNPNPVVTPDQPEPPTSPEAISKDDNPLSETETTRLPSVSVEGLRKRIDFQNSPSSVQERLTEQDEKEAWKIYRRAEEAQQAGELHDLRRRIEDSAARGIEWSQDEIDSAESDILVRENKPEKIHIDLSAEELDAEKEAIEKSSLSSEKLARLQELKDEIIHELAERKVGKKNLPTAEQYQVAREEYQDLLRTGLTTGDTYTNAFDRNFKEYRQTMRDGMRKVLSARKWYQKPGAAFIQGAIELGGLAVWAIGRSANRGVERAQLNRLIGKAEKRRLK